MPVKAHQIHCTKHHNTHRADNSNISRILTELQSMQRSCSLYKIMMPQKQLKIEYISLLNVGFQEHRETNDANGLDYGHKCNVIL